MMSHPLAAGNHFERPRQPAAYVSDAWLRSGWSAMAPKAYSLHQCWAIAHRRPERFDGPS